MTKCLWFRRFCLGLSPTTRGQRTEISRTVVLDVLPSASRLQLLRFKP